MRRCFLLIAAAQFFAFGLWGTATAQEIPPPPEAGRGRGLSVQMPSFPELDKNKDKKLGRDEVPSQFPPQFFDRLDENHDGFIDEEEWNRRMRGGGGGGGGPRVTEQLTKFLDSNNDGKIIREEFAQITRLFEVLDRDHNAEVSTEELGRFFQAIGELKTQATGGVEVEALFERLDKNKDSKITADEMGNEKTFKALDLDRDGAITKEEADKATKQLKERSREKNPESVGAASEPSKKPE